MQENENQKKESWKSVEEYLASEIINGSERKIKKLLIGMVCVTLVSMVSIIGLLITNHSNMESFIGYLSEYDFVSQDGEGFNYYNSDIGGNVNNGSESETTEEQEKGKGNRN